MAIWTLFLVAVAFAIRIEVSPKLEAPVEKNLLVKSRIINLVADL